MKSFIHDDFLLDTPAAAALYHEYAKGMPIIDYHCHIPPKDIARDAAFDGITQLWLGGDHYKWRAMRGLGVEERLITGDADPFERFAAWAGALDSLVGNPLYHWTYLELKRYFDYDGPLNADTAREVYQHCNARLKNPDMTARGLIRRSNVKWIGTTDDPADDLAHHESLAGEDTGFTMAPAFRPDGALNIHKARFGEYILRLGRSAGVEIDGMESLYAALDRRMEYFARRGCVLSDHGTDSCVYAPADQGTLEGIIKKALLGQRVTAYEAEAYQTAVLCHLAGWYARHGWAMQLHFSCLRDPNTRALATLGRDAGFDSMRAQGQVDKLAQLLDAIDGAGGLPNTIVYSLNPADNPVIDSVCGAFCSQHAQVRHGAAWWFNDTLGGMQDHLQSLAAVGALGSFLGMLTDSRSLLSYTRHEYFRRILCKTLGRWVQDGLCRDDTAALGRLVQDICYHNARRFLALDL